MTSVDPIAVTEMSVVFSAVALPLTYVPILVAANDPEHMGEQGHVRQPHGVGVPRDRRVAAVAALPLMILTGAGS